MTLKKLLIWFVLCTVSVKAQDKPKKTTVKSVKIDTLQLDTIRIQQKELQEILKKELTRPSGASLNP